MVRQEHITTTVTSDVEKGVPVVRQENPTNTVLTNMEDNELINDNPTDSVHKVLQEEAQLQVSSSRATTSNMKPPGFTDRISSKAQDSDKVKFGSLVVGVDNTENSQGVARDRLAPEQASSEIERMVTGAPMSGPNYSGYSPVSKMQQEPWSHRKVQQLEDHRSCHQAAALSSGKDGTKDDSWFTVHDQHHQWAKVDPEDQGDRDNQAGLGVQGSDCNNANAR